MHFKFDKVGRYRKRNRYLYFSKPRFNLLSYKSKSYASNISSYFNHLPLKLLLIFILKEWFVRTIRETTDKNEPELEGKILPYWILRQKRVQ